MKKYIFIIIVSFLFFTPKVFAADLNSFILDQIWYSEDSFKEGETVKIYTAVWNGNDNPLSVKVEFYNKNIILGTRDIVVPVQKLEEVSVSWKVVSGEHSFLAKILSANLSTKEGEKEVSLKPHTTSIHRKFIPVMIKKEDGREVPSNQIVKGELVELGQKIEEIVPDSVSKPVKTSFDTLDVFRNQTLDKIIESKIKTENKILEYQDYKDNVKPENLESATERPIAQVKLFFLNIVEFVFNNKIVFYFIFVVTLFYFIRSLYRKIRNR